MCSTSLLMRGLASTRQLRLLCGPQQQAWCWAAGLAWIPSCGSALRCNASRAERKIWLDIAGCQATTLCVEFCYPRELCLQRGDHRLDHPTLRPGRMTNAMDQMTKDFQSPALQVRLRCYHVHQDLKCMAILAHQVTMCSEDESSAYMQAGSMDMMCLLLPS